ncbi:MAG: hypothetical protein ABIU77_19255, partial [Ferruginibacter sp.]
ALKEQLKQQEISSKHHHEASLLPKNSNGHQLYLHQEKIIMGHRETHNSNDLAKQINSLIGTLMEPTQLPENQLPQWLQKPVQKKRKPHLHL